MNRKTPVSALLCVCGFLLAPSPVTATAYDVTIDTTAISGISAQIAFDFIDGGPNANSVVVSGFTTDGALHAQSTTGTVTGALPADVTLSDAGFFNELLADITLGSQTSFRFTPTANPPAAGSLPDAFSVFLLDPSTFLPLFATTDPTGADALFRFDIDGTSAGALSVFAAPNQEAIVSANPAGGLVPEPATWTLVLLGALGVGTRRQAGARGLGLVGMLLYRSGRRPARRRRSVTASA